MADIKTLVEEAKRLLDMYGAHCWEDGTNGSEDRTDQCKSSRRAVRSALDALAEAHQAEVARLTRENEGLAKDAAASLPHALSTLKAEALEIFDGPETAQDVRDVIEWYSASIDVAMGHARRRIDAALAGASGAQEGERT